MTSDQKELALNFSGDFTQTPVVVVFRFLYPRHYTSANSSSTHLKTTLSTNYRQFISVQVWETHIGQVDRGNKAKNRVTMCPTLDIRYQYFTKNVVGWIIETTTGKNNWKSQLSIDLPITPHMCQVLFLRGDAASLALCTYTYGTDEVSGMTCYPAPGVRCWYSGEDFSYTYGHGKNNKQARYGRSSPIGCHHHPAALRSLDHWEDGDIKQRTSKYEVHPLVVTYSWWCSSDGSLRMRTTVNTAK